jgi:hypothetical protein
MVLALALATLDLECDRRWQLALGILQSRQRSHGACDASVFPPYTNYTALSLSQDRRARCKQEKREANKYASAEEKALTDVERRPEFRRKEAHERRERIHAVVNLQTAVSTAATREA